MYFITILIIRFYKLETAPKQAQFEDHSETIPRYIVGLHFGRVDDICMIIFLAFWVHSQFWTAGKLFLHVAAGSIMPRALIVKYFIYL